MTFVGSWIALVRFLTFSSVLLFCQCWHLAGNGIFSPEKGSFGRLPETKALRGFGDFWEEVTTPKDGRFIELWNKLFSLCPLRSQRISYLNLTWPWTSSGSWLVAVHRSIAVAASIVGSSSVCVHLSIHNSKLTGTRSVIRVQGIFLDYCWGNTCSNPPRGCIFL